MQQKLRNGGWPNLAPVGYVYTRVDRGGRRAEPVLTADPEQALLVRKAFELYASGEHTITSLHEQMTELGLRNKRGAPMSRSKLAAMLHNKLDAGIVVFNGVEYGGAHEPLVPQDLFDRAQEVCLHDRDRVRERKHPHFLRGLVACGSCGSAMSSMVARGRSSYYSYFYCLGRFTGRTGFKEPYIAQEDLEAIVERVYRGLELAKDEEDCLRAALEQEIADEVSFSAKSLALAKKRRAKAEAELDRAVSAYLAGAVDMKLYKREQERLKTGRGRGRGACAGCRSDAVHG